jgi:hypothetical protein
VPFGPLTEKNASCVISKRNGLFIIMVSAATDLHFRQSMKKIKTFNFKLKEMKSFEYREDRVVKQQGRWRVIDIFKNWMSTTKNNYRIKSEVIKKQFWETYIINEG